MKNLIVVLLVVVLLFATVGTALAKPPDHAGSGGRPAHAKAKVDRNDPDDDGRGPDRGDGSRDNEDWNNGCGNDNDRTDDNEGWCGRKPKPQKPTKPIVTVKPVETCKLRAVGDVVEIFPLGWRHTDGEKGLIKEARGEIEHTLGLGEGVTVFFWTERFGHSAYAYYGEVICQDGEDILVVERTYPDGTFSPR